MKSCLWAKTFCEKSVVKNDNGKEEEFKVKRIGIGVVEHSLAVSRCAFELLEKRDIQFKKYHNLLAALVSLHDIGKITPQFQCNVRKGTEQGDVKEWKEKYYKNIERYSFDKKYHGHATYLILSNPKYLSNKISHKKWFRAIGAHHGYHDEEYGGDTGFEFKKEDYIAFPDINWEQEVKDTIETLLSNFGYTKESFLTDLDNLNQLSKSFNENVVEFLGDVKSIGCSFTEWLAGLTSMSDWIGSDEKYFDPNPQFNDHSVAQVQKAIEEIGISIPDVKKNVLFEQIFPFQPNEMQKIAIDAIKASDYTDGMGALYIIEGSMGTGKTEAALGMYYKLAQFGLTTGFFFALPTQATANRLVERVDGRPRQIDSKQGVKIGGFLNAILENPTKSMLIHGNSWLFESYKEYGAADQDTDFKNHSFEWFNTSKKALLYPFGVGTVDQLLSGVINVKHFFMRLFALSGKTIIIDEVHTYDKYTGGLVDELIKKLLPLGCTIIILSATLTKQRKNELLKCEVDDDRYPLLTSFVNGKVTTTALGQSESKKVKITYAQKTACINKAIAIARAGGRVLWVCNTVASSQKTYKKLLGNEFEVGLLHSKFKFVDRVAKESYWMGVFGKNAERRGCILVATQVVEQSVDLDADLLISELAPMDMLFQRIGRLWRHDRGDRPVGFAECMVIKADEDLHRDLGDKALSYRLGKSAYVYHPYILLRTHDVVSEMKEVTFPDDLRDRLEEVYEEIEETGSYEFFKNEMFIKNEAMRMLKNKVVRKDTMETESDKDDLTPVTRLGKSRSAIIICDSFDEKAKTIVFQGKPFVLNKEKNVPLARAIHKNSVYISDFLIAKESDNKALEQYVFGHFCVASQNQDSSLTFLSGIEKNQMNYTFDLGIYVADKD